MKLVLTGLERLEIQDPSPEPLDQEQSKDLAALKVKFCGVCRTDAKMWHQGQRDLVLPRVLGHEVVAQDDKGINYVIWPGKSCGHCIYCSKGMENLCDDLKIMGFDYDGGFSHVVLAPKESLIPIPEAVPVELATFSEPLGCAIHALDMLPRGVDEDIIIFGGGSVGLLCALYAQEVGFNPLVIEKDERKIHKIQPFLSYTGIECLKETARGHFHKALNACDDAMAFALGIHKLHKGGNFSFFSGLTKNKELESNLINLIHYKELEVQGAYGCLKSDMVKALDFIRTHPAALEFLVEDKIHLIRVPEILPRVLSGAALKFIVDMEAEVEAPALASSLPTTQKSPIPGKYSHGEFDSPYRNIIQGIRPVSNNLLPAAQSKIDNKTKPLGALGRLEDLAVQLCLVQGTLEPHISRKALFVFAADHGVTEEGVSAYPSEVTYQMVLNFLQGGAAINVLCRHNGIEIKVVDMGVKGEFQAHPSLINKKVRSGTANFSLGPAMTPKEAVEAIQHGMDVVLSQVESGPIDIIGLGDMGIGNTTASAAIISAVTGLDPQLATGRGTGVDDKGLEHKANVIAKALEFHGPDPQVPLDVLHKVGGLEIAGIAGAILAAAAKGTVAVLDGVISTAGGLIAYLINPAIKGYLVAGHRSVEPAHKAALEFMGLEPLLDLKMRLGEGTGAALAINLVEASAKIMKEMASFEEAGVSGKK